MSTIGTTTTHATTAETTPTIWTGNVNAFTMSTFSISLRSRAVDGWWLRCERTAKARDGDPPDTSLYLV
jgi:hypothetical protein